MMRAMRTVPYGDHDRQKLDVFLPADVANGRCLFLVHGGGWSGGSRDQWHQVAERFRDQGYVAVSAGYRLAPETPWPGQIEDMRAALALTRALANEYGFDSSRVVAMGSSAGGHLVAMLATIGAGDEPGLGSLPPETDTRPNAVVCYCPVTTLANPELQSGQLAAAYGKLIASEDGRCHEEYVAASPLHRVTGAEPPFLFVHGDADETVPLAQSESMSNALESAGVRADLVVLPGVDHGFGYGVTTAHQQRSLAAIDSFLDGVLPPPPTGED